MKTYFLSYARADGKTALRFADDLIAAGVSVWVDQYDIRPSQHWDRAVETAVRGCHGMIVILSPRSAASPNVADEVSVAIDGGKAVIPILIEPCTLPLRMTRMQFIDATADYDGALRRCLAEARDAGDEAAVPPPPRAAVLPDEVLRDAERRLTGFMGPIAHTLVTAAAAHAATAVELYAELGKAIPHAAEREAFLGWVKPAGAPPQDALPDEDLRMIVDALKHHLGPIAANVVEREQALATSRPDLCLRLGRHIAGAKDRAAFLKRVAAG